MASARLSLLLALEVALNGRASADLRTLIRRISIENPLWGAPRIHGELLKLGFEVAQSTVAKYMASERDRQLRDGALFCVTTRQTIGGSSSGSMLQQIRRLNGLHAS
jgi:hypothetical protein